MVVKIKLLNSAPLLLPYIISINQKGEWGMQERFTLKKKKASEKCQRLFIEMSIITLYNKLLLELLHNNLLTFTLFFNVF